MEIYFVNRKINFDDNMVKPRNLMYMLSFLLFNLRIKLKLVATISDVLLTLKCPNRCDHCLYRAGPEHNEFLDEKYFEKVIRGLKKIGCKFISPIGGEPFLYLKGLEKFIKLSKKYSCEIAVFTSCRWATSHKKSFSILSRLKKSGLKYLVISTDAFHLKRVPIENVKSTLRSCNSLGISTCLRVTYTKNFEPVISPIIKLAKTYKSRILIESLCFWGRASKFNPDDFRFNWKEVYNIEKEVNGYGIKDLMRKNFERLNFLLSCPFGPVVYPNGDLFLCYCSKPGLLVGNIKNSGIEEMVSNFNKSFFKRSFFIMRYFMKKDVSNAKIRCDICPFTG